jgi:hypothetical protein
MLRGFPEGVAMADVRNYGAVGDGDADDTDAIQHAVGDGDGVLVLPRGDYRISRTIVVDLAASGRTGIDGSAGTARLTMTGPGPAVLFRGGHGGNADPRNLSPAVWERERMPVIRDLEIAGTHPEADGIRLEGVMQPTVTGVLLRGLRHGIHVTRRARNLLVSHCHIYRNTGIGIFLDEANLHQVIVTGSHVSYCRLGGIRITGGEIRNVQITGNDIEYNNNKSIGMPDADGEPTAEVYVDCRGGSIREGTLASNTIQATPSPGGANIRFLGGGASHKAGMWTIAGNLIGNQEVNIHLEGCAGFAITGNYVYSATQRTILVERSRAISLGANVIGHNPDYGDKELATGVRFVECQDCIVEGLSIQDALAGRHTVDGVEPAAKEALVELVRSRRMTVAGCHLLEGTPVGLLVEDCHDTLVTGCTILDDRPMPLMRTAIEWRSRDGRPPAGCGVHGCRLQDLAVPETVSRADNIVAPPTR